jgi:ligand-binding sensor domain-containing protein
VKRLLYIILIFSITGTEFLYAQRSDQFRFEDISKNVTFSHNEITAIAQDKQGFIWVGTRSGLNRFDGVKAKMYLHEPGNSHSLSSNWIENIYCDSSGYIFVATRKYLNVFDPKTERFYEIKHSFPPACENKELTAISMLKESDSVLWYTTFVGLQRLDLKTMKTERMPLPQAYENRGWHCFMVDLVDDHKGNLWFQ